MSVFVYFVGLSLIQKSRNIALKLFIYINPSLPNPGQREKIILNFVAQKAFIKPFEAPQGSAKIKILVNFYFNVIF